MRQINELTDDEIDALLLGLFNSTAPKAPLKSKSQALGELSIEDLRRIRSRNHPDKWPQVDLDAYRAAVEEIDRRRQV